MANELLEKDIQAIIEAGGSDRDVENYLKESGVSYSIEEEQPTKKSRLKPAGQFNKVDRLANYFMPQALSEQEYAPGEKNIFGDIQHALSRPGGAVRSAILPSPGKGRIESAVSGFQRPETTPTFQEKAYKKFGPELTGNKTANFAKAFPSVFAGTALDVATDPVNYAGGIVARFLGKSKAVKAVAGEAGREFGKAGQLVKTTAQEIMESPLAETAKRGADKVVKSIENLFNLPGKAIRTTKSGFKTLEGLKLPFTSTLEREKTGIHFAKTEKMRRMTEAKADARFRLNKWLDEVKAEGASEEDIVKLKFQASQQLEERTRYELAQLKDTTQQVFENNKKVLEGKFQDVTEQGALQYQKALPEFGSSIGDTYETMLDDVADMMEIKRGKLNIQEVNNILRGTIEEANTDNLNFGRIYDKINDLWTGKYATSTSNLDKAFSLQEVKSDISQVFKLVKYGQRGTSEEIPAHILRKHWGNFTTSNVEGYSDMQSFYSDVVDALKLGDKIFKPKAGELYAEKGIGFLRKFGMAERPSLPQQKLITALEQGTEKAGGVGPISKPITDLGAEIRSLENAYQIAQRKMAMEGTDIGMKFGKTQFELAQELKQVQEAGKVMRDKLSNRLDNLNIRSLHTKNALAIKFDKQILELESKIADRKKAVALARMLAGGVGWAAGAYGIARVATNILGFRESFD